MQFSLKQTN